MTVPLSILDLVPVRTGSSAHESVGESLELARLAERLGFTRYWFAEHHGMPSIASSAPEILIAHIAAGTDRIRVGSGGIMLQNHVPLKVAENFHTLATLHPGRIDLGIGRAPGTDPVTSKALHPFGPERFREQLMEVIGLSRGELPPDHPFRSVRVIPDGVELPPIWLLGSSGASAMLAGSLGTGYSFASHFSPAPARPAFDAYRESFIPSGIHPVPHAILAVAVICAETDDEAQYHAASGDLMWVRLNRGEYAAVPSPDESLAYPYTANERSIADARRALNFVGTPRDVRERVERAAQAAGADEIMISSIIHSPTARRRSFELLMKAF